MPPDDPTSQAADLAESLVEAISEPIQDWKRIEQSARALAKLAGQASQQDADERR